jgi:hypothetical protein
LQFGPPEQERGPLILGRKVLSREGIHMSRVRHRPFLCSASWAKGRGGIGMGLKAVGGRVRSRSPALKPFMIDHAPVISPAFLLRNEPLEEK